MLNKTQQKKLQSNALKRLDESGKYIRSKNREIRKWYKDNFKRVYDAKGTPEYNILLAITTNSFRSIVRDIESDTVDTINTNTYNISSEIIDKVFDSELGIEQLDTFESDITNELVDKTVDNFTESVDKGRNWNSTYLRGAGVIGIINTVKKKMGGTTYTKVTASSGLYGNLNRYSNSFTLAQIEKSKTIFAPQSTYVKKEWVHGGGGDNPRAEHVAASGMRVGVNEYFNIGGSRTRAPHEFGDPAQDYNCTCYLVFVF